MDTQQETELSSAAADAENDEGWSFKEIAIAAGAFVAIVAIAVGAFFYYESTVPAEVKEGGLAPDFSLPLLKGGTARLSSYRGKVVLINVWATWCDPCKQEMPSLEKLYQSLQGQPFEILASSVDARGATDVTPFAYRYGLTFPILLDVDKKLPSLFHTTGYPESFIIDKKGIMVKRIIGPLDWTNSQLTEVQLINQLVRSQ